jgi:hypothetical protein
MCASPAARRRARELCREIEPFLAEMVERNDPSVENLSFDDIEANSAAAGDLVARAMMLRALARQPATTDAEIEAAKREALRKAGPQLAADGSPGKLRMKRRRDRPRRIGTIRGEIAFPREYLYFPDLQVGVFPPPEASRDS